ncbi:hypothetical protein [Clostridium akagii]|uniref:hypothetical protein n=1 Tax=Clostridium akagii TaxID=91623 RepID=UPI00047C5457|nr:hypothetical protein [Clostridium akagii]
MISVDVPSSIRLVFENKKLLTIDFLVAAYVLTLRKKKINIYERLFYYILSLIDINEENESKVDKNEFQYHYFKIDKSLKDILIYLSNSELIELESNSGKNFSDVSLILTDRGKTVINELKGAYFIDLKEKIKVSSSIIKYKNKYYRKFVGEVYERNLYK